MNEKILRNLYPPVAEAANKVVLKLIALGIKSALFSGFRSPDDQADLYAIGRTTKNPDGDGISPQNPLGDTVTNSQPGNSYHEYGLAVDIVLFDGKGNLSWDYMHLPYPTLGETGKSFGFEWGGDWPEPKRDPPHFQMVYGLSVNDIKGIVSEEGIVGLWDKIATKFSKK